MANDAISSSPSDFSQRLRHSAATVISGTQSALFSKAAGLPVCHVSKGIQQFVSVLAV